MAEETQTTVEESAETVAEQTAVPARRRVLKLVLKPWPRTWVYAAVGVVSFVVMTASFLFLGSNTNEAEPKTVEQEDFEQKIDASWTAADLVSRARIAMLEDDYSKASAYFEEASYRVAQENLDTQIEIYYGFADIADHEGRPVVASINREHANKIELKLGAPIPLYKGALQLIEAGQLPSAARMLHKFLLRSSELNPEGRHYVGRAQNRLAFIKTKLFEAAKGEIPVLKTEPEVYFDE